jgi:ABC-type dipeptide/oligopeptide/nickel transport system ATPase component
LELESDTAYLPVYPKIDEVAIGQLNYFLLSSNWDWGFHRKYSSKSISLPVAGSIRVEEDESFLGKIVILPAEIELEQFNLVLLSENQQLSEVDLTQIEMVAKEGANTLDGYINLSNVITSYLLSDGIKQKFEDYLVNSSEFIGNFESIEDYVREYIALNILKLYEVGSTEFYSKRNATLSSSTKVKNRNAIEFVFLNDKDRFTLGYSILKSVQINKSDRLILNFSIQKSLDAGINISPKIKIKFI